MAFWITPAGHKYYEIPEPRIRDIIIQFSQGKRLVVPLITFKLVNLGKKTQFETKQNLYNLTTQFLYQNCKEKITTSKMWRKDYNLKILHSNQYAQFQQFNFRGISSSIWCAQNFSSLNYKHFFALSQLSSLKPLVHEG